MNVFVHVFFNSVPTFDPPYHLSSPTNKILRVLINNVKYTLLIGSARYLIWPDYATEDDWRNVIFDSSIPLGISDLREQEEKRNTERRTLLPKVILPRINHIYFIRQQILISFGAQIASLRRRWILDCDELCSCSLLPATRPTGACLFTRSIILR